MMMSSSGGASTADSATEGSATEGTARAAALFTPTMRTVGTDLGGVQTGVQLDRCFVPLF